MAKYTVEMVGNLKEYPKLTHQEMMQKIVAYQQSHNQVIKDELVLSNIKLVLSLVKKYQQRTQNLDDLFQVGIIGLIKSIEHFDTHLNVRFSTYAVPLIMGEMKRYMRDNSPLRIPRSMRDLAYKAMLENEKYVKLYHHDAPLQELAQRLNVNESLLNESLSSTHSVTSLSQDIQNDGSGQIDMLSQIANPKNELNHVHASIDLQKALSRLNPKERLVIDQRYFYDYTQSEIAKELMISQAQVSRLEKQAIHHLKKYME